MPRKGERQNLATSNRGRNKMGVVLASFTSHKGPDQNPARQLRALI
jgi:hypothetical protein